METHTVYILKSQKDNKNYTGFTKNIERRLIEHNSGEVKSTRHRRPLKLIHKECTDNKKEAQLREKHFKTRQGRRELKTILLEKKKNHS